MHPNIGEQKYIKQILIGLKEEIDSNTIIVPVLSITDRSSSQKINKETVDLNNNINQIDLTYTHRTFYPTATEDKFFSSLHETFSRRDHMLGHKTSLKNLRLKP